MTLSGGCGLTGKGGKVIINIRKLNLRLLRRRENAVPVQRTPPRVHSAEADYANYTGTVLNWNAGLRTIQRSSVLPIRAFSESISNVNISFFT